MANIITRGLGKRTINYLEEMDLEVKLESEKSIGITVEEEKSIALEVD